jgi:hypothetical protein
MTLYFFNMADGSYEPDETGTELPSLRDARIEAVKFAAHVLRDSPDLVWENRDFRVEVTDELGLHLFTVVTFTIDAPAGTVPVRPS